MKRFLASLAVLLLAVATAAAPARAQANFPTPAGGGNNVVPGVVVMCLNAQGQGVPQSSGQCANSGGGTVVSGTVTATPFTPSGGYAALSISSSSSNAALPAGTATIINNTGGTTAYVNLGGGSVTAATTNQPVYPGCWITVADGTNTNLAGITASSTTSLTLTGGTGGSAGGGCAPVAAITNYALETGGNLATVATNTGTTATAQGAQGTGSTFNPPTGGSGVIGFLSGIFKDLNNTLAISAAALPLPTGASTAANQTAVQGTVAAGTAATNSQLAGAVYNSGGVTLTTGQQAALQFDSAGYLMTQDFGDYAQGSTTSGQVGPLAQFAVTTSIPSYMNGQTSPGTVTTSGGLRVQLQSGTNIIGAATAADAAGTLIGQAVLNQGELYNNSTWDRQRDIGGAVVAGTGDAAVAIAPTSAAAAGITPVVSAAGENNHVLKNSAGNLYWVYATNLTATAGFLVVLNATTNPADGAITPIECVPLPANGNASISRNPGPIPGFSTGIVAVVTSATTCFTKTTGTITAFINGGVQ